MFACLLDHLLVERDMLALEVLDICSRQDVAVPVPHVLEVFVVLEVECVAEVLRAPSPETLYDGVVLLLDAILADQYSYLLRGAARAGGRVWWLDRLDERRCVRIVSRQARRADYQCEAPLSDQPVIADLELDTGLLVSPPRP